MTSSTPANEFVTDTMGLVLQIERRKLSPAVRAVFALTEAGSASIYVPGTVFAEILYLSEKGRISCSIQDVENYLTQYPNYKEQPLSLAVIQSAAQITDIPELHDRLIAATARLLDLRLITNDPIIQTSGFVQTIW